MGDQKKIGENEKKSGKKIPASDIYDLSTYW